MPALAAGDSGGLFKVSGGDISPREKTMLGMLWHLIGTGEYCPPPEVGFPR